MRKDLNIPNALLSVIGPGLTYANQSDICLTPSCIKAAAHMLNNLHPDYHSIDPCTDFDEYACGGFPARWPNEESFDTIKEVQSINTYELKNILDGPYPKTANSSDEDEEIFDILVTNYKSCMNEEAVEASGLAGIPDIISKIAELFPVEDGGYKSDDTISDKDYDALTDVLVYLSEIGVPVFGEFWTVIDMQNPDVVVPIFGFNAYEGADHALPSQIRISELALVPEDDLKEVLEGILPDGAAKDSASELAKGVSELVLGITGIEALLQNETEAESFAGYYHTTTVEDAAKVAPALVIDKVIERLAPEGYKLDRMNFQYPDTYANISTAISEAPKSVVQALFMVMAHSSYAPYVKGSTSPEVDRWETCYTYVDSSLPWIASKFFLDVTYKDEKGDFVHKMAEELKEAFSNRVEKLDWVDDKTKDLIQEKIEKMDLKIGYPQENPDARSPTELLKYYDGINITESLFDNVLSIRKWSVTQAWNLLSAPTDFNLWPEQNAHAYVTGARFLQNANSIVVPNGIAQPPIFFDGAPSYLMYSTIGLVSGHEITHGFDTNGRNFNQDRQYKPWWDESSTEAYNNRTACFVEQFSSMEAKDHNGVSVTDAETKKTLTVNGAKTLSENIADSGGLANAYGAWELHEATSPSQHLPGLESFTKEQLFFLGFGQVWCSKTSQDSLRTYIKDNIHAPPFARIRGVSANSRAFREAFNCEKKEPVCELW